MPSTAESLIQQVTAWAQLRDDIRGLVLVGSRARGDAQADADIDLVVLCVEPQRYLEDTDWLSSFGTVENLSFEDWGNVRSIRVSYESGPEVEFGMTHLDWTTVPLDPGTGTVLRSGNSVLLDRDGQIAAAIRDAFDFG
jgi:hypothetical protein